MGKKLGAGFISSSLWFQEVPKKQSLKNWTQKEKIEMLCSFLIVWQLSELWVLWFSLLRTNVSKLLPGHAQHSQVELLSMHK